MNTRLQNSRSVGLWALCLLMLYAATDLPSAGRDMDHVSEEARRQHEARVAWHEAYNQFPAKVTVRVVDERGEPIEGAEVTIGFGNSQQSEMGHIPNFNTGRGLSDADGRFSFEGRSDGNTLMLATKDGFYSSRIHHDRRTELEIRQWIRDNPGAPVPEDYRIEPWNPEVELTLVEAGQRVDLVRRPPSTLWIPRKDEAFPYDLLAGDFLPPLGQGQHADVTFRLTIEATDGDQIRADLEMRFLGEGNGLNPIHELPPAESDLQYAREAPADGWEVESLHAVRWVTKPDHLVPPPPTGVAKVPEDRPKGWTFRIRSDAGGDPPGPIYGVITHPLVLTLVSDERERQGPAGSAWIGLAFNPEPGNRSFEGLVKNEVEPWQVRQPDDTVYLLAINRTANSILQGVIGDDKRPLMIWITMEGLLTVSVRGALETTIRRAEVVHEGKRLPLVSGIPEDDDLKLPAGTFLTFLGIQRGDKIEEFDLGEWQIEIDFDLDGHEYEWRSDFKVIQREPCDFHGDSRWAHEDIEEEDEQ